MLEVLREFKGLQEIVFGAMLVVFVLFMPGGIIGFLKAKVRGWEEPLRRARPADARRSPRPPRRAARSDR